MAPLCSQGESQRAVRDRHWGDAPVDAEVTLSHLGLLAKDATRDRRFGGADHVERLSVPCCRSAVANYVPFEKIDADFSPET
jgi:hypothetical protein